MVVNILDENNEYQTAIEYIQNVCDSTIECSYGERMGSVHYQTQALGVREAQAKIDKLEKEIFVLKLQLTHYRNDRPTQIDEKRLISLQIQNELQCNELDSNRCVIIKVAKLLKNAENRFTRDATEHAKQIASMAATSQCTTSYNPFDCHRKFIGDQQWTMRDQEQLYRFNFNELTEQIHQLKRQLNATKMELMEQMKIGHDLFDRLNELIVRNDYLQMKFDANEKLVSNYMNRIKRWIKLNLNMIDEINSLRNRSGSNSRSNDHSSNSCDDNRNTSSSHLTIFSSEKINQILMMQTQPVTALNWKWPIDYNGRCDETTAKYSDVKNGDFSHAITNVMPFEMIRIGCVTMASTPTMKTLPPFEHRHQHHRLIFPEQFGLTLMRFIRYQSIFVSSSPTFRTVACELRTTLLSLLDRWNSCSSAVVPLIERNQNEPIYRKRKSITVRNLFVPLIYIYLFR